MSGVNIKELFDEQDYCQRSCASRMCNGCNLKFRDSYNSFFVGNYSCLRDMYSKEVWGLDRGEDDY